MATGMRDSTALTFFLATAMAVQWMEMERTVFLRMRPLNTQLELWLCLRKPHL
uniref:Alternative protein C6orf52 n=1 Tax=Homo sapiens TaxID=9606 RepID=L8E7L0_HUMAN|nr:alternative protein C6orf52 [Homo sapiens]